MRMAVFTNIRSPYRILQFNEFSKIKNLDITVYYTYKKIENRKWEEKKSSGYKEIFLKGLKISNKYGYFNMGIYNIVSNSDIILIGGYEQPTYILISIICKLLKKPYIIFFDGISTNRVGKTEMFLKKLLKKIVIKNSEYIMGNGIVSKKYFNENFNYPLDRIYNQYLTVDSNTINGLYKERCKYREYYRKKYNIESHKKVIIYSGRAIKIKNIDLIIKAISKLENDKPILLITGGGEEEKNLKDLADELGVEIIITGFITDQKELFKHYYAGDLLILPSSVYEVWGLVVNEAMFSGLPVLVSNICGCKFDLVKEGVNGYTFDPFDVDDLVKKIIYVLGNNNSKNMGLKSREIIIPWTFTNSRMELEKIISKINYKEI